MKPSTPWIIALLASVLANGVLAGFVLHRTAEGPDWTQGARQEEARRPQGRRGSGFGLDLREMMSALPEDTRREARRRARENRDGIRALFGEARQAREEFETIMRAETFDREAAAEVLQDLRDIRDRFERGVEADLLELIGDLDPETRAAVIEAAGDDDRRRHRRGGPDGPRDGRRGEERPFEGRPRDDGPPPADAPQPE